MTDENWPTNKEAFDYFKSKNNNSLSLDYAKLNPPNEGSDEYVIMFNEFSSSYYREDKDNQSLFQVLECWQNSNIFTFSHTGRMKEIPITHNPQLDSINPFSQVTNIDFLHPKENVGGMYNQKWHLFIAVFAYSLVCGTNNVKEWQWDKSNYDQGSGYWAEDFFHYWKKGRGKNLSPQVYPSIILRLWVIENIEDEDFQRENVKPLRDIINDYLVIKNNKGTFSRADVTMLNKDLKKSINKLILPQVLAKYIDGHASTTDKN